MSSNNYDAEYLTFSEVKEEFPKAAQNFNWSAKMFYYLSQTALIRRRYNYSIKSHEYEKKSLLLVIKLINSNLDDLRIDP